MSDTQVHTQSNILYLLRIGIGISTCTGKGPGEVHQPHASKLEEDRPEIWQLKGDLP